MKHFFIFHPRFSFCFIISLVYLKPLKPFIFNIILTSTCKAWEVCSFSLSPAYYRLPPAAWAVRVGSWLQSRTALIWASLWFKEYRALLGCFPRAMLECKSSGGGAEGSDPCVMQARVWGMSYIEVGCIINRVTCGFWAAAGKQERWMLPLTAQL